MSEHHAEGLTFILPVCNQAACLDQATAAWSTELAKLNRPYEMFLIDDGSTDATQSIIAGSEGKPGLPQRVPHLRVLTHETRRGYGACIREGIAAAQHPLIFYTGCDFPYRTSDLPKFLPFLNEIEPVTGNKVGVVTGYRANTPVQGWPKLISRIWRGFLRIACGYSAEPSKGWLGKEEHRYARLLRAMFGLRVGDPNSKFKLFRKQIFDRIPIQSDGDFVHAEILSKANFLSCPVVELPIAERPGPFTAVPEPPSPIDRGTELRRVFFNPNFGPTVISPPAVASA